MTFRGGGGHPFELHPLSRLLFDQLLSIVLNKHHERAT